jgi:hypothetical protein
MRTGIFESGQAEYARNFRGQTSFLSAWTERGFCLKHPPSPFFPMLTGVAALESTDWLKLHHAYGPAVDTPEHLRALLKPESAPREAALKHLWSAIIHQGTPWSATGPVALVLAGLLSDKRLGEDHLIRAKLVRFLVGVAEAAASVEVSLEETRAEAARDIEAWLKGDGTELFEDHDASNTFMARAYLGCIEAAPVLWEVMVQNMESQDSGVRSCASMGAACLARTTLIKQHAATAKSRIYALARSAQDPDERSAHVLALGELGASPTEFLSDTSLPVQMCAALAPALASDPVALERLLYLLERNTSEIDRWFKVLPPQFHHHPRFDVISRLVAQVKDFDRLADAAIKVIAVAAKYSVDFDWGPLLAAAFADGSGVAQTAAQHRYLSALVNKRELWDPKFGNARMWFKKAGLPYDRAICAKRVQADEY